MKAINAAKNTKDTDSKDTSLKQESTTAKINSGVESAHALDAGVSQHKLMKPKLIGVGNCGPPTTTNKSQVNSQS